MKLTKQRCPATCDECANFWPPQIPIPVTSTPRPTTAVFKPQVNIVPKSGTCEDTNKNACDMVKQNGLCDNPLLGRGCLYTCGKCEEEAAAVTTTRTTATTTTTTAATTTEAMKEIFGGTLENFYSDNDCERVKKASFCDNPDFGSNCRKTCKGRNYLLMV